MRIPTRLAAAVVVLMLASSACSNVEPSATTTSAPTTSSTTMASTTSSSLPSTTTSAPQKVDVTGDIPEDLAAMASELLSWMADHRNPAPSMPEGLGAALEDVTPPPLEVAAAGSFRALPNGDRVAVVMLGDDYILASAPPEGEWDIAGASLREFGAEPWLGESPRMALILGSDARPGQNQLRYRADSIHVVSLSPATSEGTILGFPRDSWVDSPKGMIKFTNLMAGSGPEIMLDTARTLTGLPLEGYVVTGFKGFTALVDELGGLQIDIPKLLKSGNNWANFPAGEQLLNATRALQLARIRKGLPGGDFDRSWNQGMIMLAALEMVKADGIEDLPNKLALLLENAWTDLATADLLTLAAAAYAASPETLSNTVVPGKVGSAGGASVVFLGDEATAIFEDMQDGLLSGG